MISFLQNKGGPIRLYLRVLVIYLILFVGGGLLIRGLFPQDIKFISSEFYLVGGSFLILSLSLTFWYALSPLSRITKTLSNLIDNQNFSEEVVSKALAFQSSPGEWRDFENEIKKIIKILRKNFKALSREKIEIQAVMNSVEEPIFAVDQSERVVFYNPAFGMVFSLEAGTQGFVSAHQILPDANVLAAIREVLKTGDPYESEVDFFIASQPYSFTLVISPLKRETDESTYGAVCVFHDRSLQIETNKKRLDFVANASHELRTPVTMIASAVSLLQKNIEDKNLKAELLESLKENSKRLVNLTEGLLDLSTMESGDRMDLVTVGAQEFTHKFLSLNNFTNSNISIECYPRDVPVYADMRRLDQVLTNLITNAVRYSDRESHIKIIWEEVEGGCVLRVQDRGPGVSEKHVQRIFERFYRVDVARTRKMGGTGIGLAIVKHIMKMHKGDVSVNLEYKDGAEFICFFPG